MSFPVRFRVVLLCAALATSACAKQVNIALTLVVSACSDGITPPPVSPLSNVGNLRFLLTIDGGVQSPIDVAQGQDSEKLPQLPLDTPLRLDVFGLDAATNSVPLSFGSTGDFTISSVTAPSTVQLTVVLRTVDAFAGTPVLSSPSTCATLNHARAYHAQTLLTDGRVLIYGGLVFPDAVDWSLVYGLPAQPVPGTTYLSDSEIYNPSTGTFTEGPSFTGADAGSTRAFATLLASLAADGGADFVGGETPTGPGGALVGNRLGGAYSPTEGWSVEGTHYAHDHGCVAEDIAGHAFLAGGLDPNGVAVSGAEFPGHDVVAAAGGFRHTLDVR